MLRALFVVGLVSLTAWRCAARRLTPPRRSQRRGPRSKRPQEIHLHLHLHLHVHGVTAEDIAAIFDRRDNPG
jgi:hypothetical protein